MAWTPPIGASGLSMFVDYRNVLGPAIPRALNPASGARLPSGIAGIRVDVEVGQFNAAWARYTATVNANMAQEVTRVALDLLARIQKKTPVDTGRLRASFHAVLPGETDRYTYQDKEGRTFNGSLGVKGDSVALGDWVLGRGDGKVGAVVGTNVDYAIYIEAGHSRKAPNGMVAISVAELTGALERAVARALEQASRHL